MSEKWGAVGKFVTLSWWITEYRLVHFPSTRDRKRSFYRFTFSHHLFARPRTGTRNLLSFLFTVESVDGENAEKIAKHKERNIKKNQKMFAFGINWKKSRRFVCTATENCLQSFSKERTRKEMRWKVIKVGSDALSVLTTRASNKLHNWKTFFFLGQMPVHVIYIDSSFHRA